MNTELPKVVKACLWSYDTDAIDLSAPTDRVRIIKNILNRGTKDAIDWLMINFTKEEIAETIVKTNASEWNKKSLSLWSLVFRVYPAKEKRFV